jgi:sulfide dehydrogenase [flavocytochrome c] flavoprotein chain
MAQSRRKFLAGAAAAAGTAWLGAPAIAQGRAACVVVIGGGFGGATAAKYLRRLDPKLDVTLIERTDTYLTCPFSNYALAGFRKLEQNLQRYDKLQRQHRVRVVSGRASVVDTGAKSVTLSSGQKYAYDKLIVAPGIDLRFDAVPGYNEKASERMPHAWRAGVQTTLLRRQLLAMKNGGTFILCAPDNPFRCPPGPYERASVIAWYFKTQKPKSKILILDAKDTFSKQGLFQAAWESEFPGMITWVAGKDGGKVVRVDPATMTVHAGFGAEKGDVVNFIPPQTAGAIAIAAGLADDKGWCPIDPQTFASQKARDVFVLGDAAIAGAMPKSASAANTQAKVAAAAIVAQLSGKTPEAPALFNVCYSLVTPEYGISVTNAFMATSDRGIVAIPNSGGVSRANAPADRRLEAEHTTSWYRSITADSWG